MKIKTATLTGPALNWAAAKCEGRPYSYTLNDIKGEPPLVVRAFEPSTSWQEAGPIIEREGISLEWSGWGGDEQWLAYIRHDEEIAGPTPLIAAMRCYVASKMGDTIDIPEELA